jgi:hypothetical protein
MSVTVKHHSVALAAIGISREVARQCLVIFTGEGKTELAKAEMERIASLDASADVLRKDEGMEESKKGVGK